MFGGRPPGTGRSLELLAYIYKTEIAPIARFTLRYPVRLLLRLKTRDASDDERESTERGAKGIKNCSESRCAVI